MKLRIANWLRWIALFSVQVYICLITLPAAATQTRVSFVLLLPTSCFIVAVLTGYLLVLPSRSSECWQDSIAFGALSYFGVIVALAAQTRFIGLPVPHLFIIPGCAIGGLLHWRRIATPSKETVIAT